ncbi:MAG: DUF4388 domain-containing protein [Myxococcales bacterium FL481]|nr:MAG: DUF4388 domain-containing protein [Myxococcales bacterium FL481]
MTINILIVEPDTPTRRLLEVGLRDAGYEVDAACSGEEALELVRRRVPNVVLCAAPLAHSDAYTLCRQLADASPGTATSILLITDSHAIEERVRGVEAGADGFLARPICLPEARSQIQALLQKRDHGRLASSARRPTLLEGHLEDVGFVAILQLIESSDAGGVITLRCNGERGSIWYAHGRVLDAVCGRLTGRRAVYRLMTWRAGTYRSEPLARTGVRAIPDTTRGLVMEGLRRLEQWNRLVARLPPLHARLLAAEPNANDNPPTSLSSLQHALWAQFDGRRTLQQILDASDDDLVCLRAIERLLTRGRLVPAYDESPNGGRASAAPSAPPAVRTNSNRDSIAAGGPEPAWRTDSPAEGLDPGARQPRPQPGLPEPAWRPDSPADGLNPGAHQPRPQPGLPRDRETTRTGHGSSPDWPEPDAPAPASAAAAAQTSAVGVGDPHLVRESDKDLARLQALASESRPPEPRSFSPEPPARDRSVLADTSAVPVVELSERDAAASQREVDLELPSKSDPSSHGNRPAQRHDGSHRTPSPDRAHVVATGTTNEAPDPSEAWVHEVTLANASGQARPRERPSARRRAERQARIVPTTATSALVPYARTETTPPPPATMPRHVLAAIAGAGASLVLLWLGHHALRGTGDDTLQGSAASRGSPNALTSRGQKSTIRSSLPPRSAAETRRASSPDSPQPAAGPAPRAPNDRTPVGHAPQLSVPPSTGTAERDKPALEVPGPTVAGIQDADARPAAVALLEAAEDALQAGRYERAQQLAADLPSDALHDARSQLLLAKLALERAAFSDAVNHARRASELDPGLAPAYLALGVAHRGRDEPREAMAAYQRYLELEPDSVYARSLERELQTLRDALPRAPSP